MDEVLNVSGLNDIKFELTEPASLFALCDDATTARYWMTFLVFSVLPAPDSPLLNIGIKNAVKLHIIICIIIYLSGWFANIMILCIKIYGPCDI